MQSILERNDLDEIMAMVRVCQCLEVVLNDMLCMYECGRTGHQL